MKDIIQKIKFPLIIIVVLLAMFVLYNTLIKKPASTDTLAKTNTASASTPGQQILPLLLKIKDVNFDTQFFNDPSFKSLKDFGQKIISEDQGRANPFAPSSFEPGSSSVEDLGFVDENQASAQSATSSTNTIPPKSN